MPYFSQFLTQIKHITGCNTMLCSLMCCESSAIASQISVNFPLIIFCENSGEAATLGTRPYCHHFELVDQKFKYRPYVLNESPWANKPQQNMPATQLLPTEGSFSIDTGDMVLFVYVFIKGVLRCNPKSSVKDLEKYMCEIGKEIYGFKGVKVFTLGGDFNHVSISQYFRPDFKSFPSLFLSEDYYQSATNQEYLKRIMAVKVLIKKSDSHISSNSPVHHESIVVTEFNYELKAIDICRRMSQPFLDKFNTDFESFCWSSGEISERPPNYFDFAQRFHDKVLGGYSRPLEPYLRAIQGVYILDSDYAEKFLASFD